ncbi:MAG: TonB C-terminal domain-containing protein [Lysobacteraceae bacterium]
MRENRADTALAVVFALLLHLVPLLLLLAASLWRAPPSSAAGEPISADVVDLNALPSSIRSALRREPVPLATPPPEPQPEALEEPPPEETLPEPLEETPPEQQLQPQEQLPDPDEVDQEEVKPDSASSDTAAREQEAKQRQGQVDLTERDRQQQAEQKARTAMELERERQLADIRRQRAEQQRAIDLSEEKLRQMADREARRASTAAASASPPPGNRGTEPNLNAAYTKALTDAIRSNWTQPDNVSALQVCKIVIRQIPGGEVVDAQVDPSCPYDEQGRRSVEAAVLKAQPLPYRGFESVFNRTLTINFRAEDR